MRQKPKVKPVYATIRVTKETLRLLHDAKKKNKCKSIDELLRSRK